MTHEVTKKNPDNCELIDEDIVFDLKEDKPKTGIECFGEDSSLKLLHCHDCGFYFSDLPEDLKEHKRRHALWLKGIDYEQWIKEQRGK